MASHGVLRTDHVRTEKDRQEDVVKIDKYQQLESKVRQRASAKDFSSETFDLTTKLIHLNPEYYTIWNVRRRCTILALLSSSSAGSSSSTESPSLLPTATTSSSTVVSSELSSPATQCNPKLPPTGPHGITAEAAATPQQQQWTEITHPHNSGPAIATDFNFLKQELVFIVPLLMRHPKCYWIWDHRIWLLQQAIKRLPPKIARGIWEEELALDNKMLMRDRRNFHAWGYRKNLVERLESPELLGSSLVQTEFDYTTQMIKADLSNFSAWHRRAMLIPRLLNENKAADGERKELLDKELDLVQNALNVGPEDQSLWYYHQFLMLNVISTDPSKSFVPSLSTEDRCTVVDEQIEAIEDLLEDYEDIKWIYEALLEYRPYKAVIEGREAIKEEKEELNKLLAKLEELDPMRGGRWKDTRVTLGL